MLHIMFAIGANTPCTPMSIIIFVDQKILKVYRSDNLTVDLGLFTNPR